MIELKLGKMSGQEVAEWLGISYKNTYRNNPKKYIQRLENFCEYEIIRGGIIVNKIYCKVYDKNLAKKATEIYLKALSEHNNLITVVGTAAEYQMGQHTIQQARNRLFGKDPININPTSRGLIGCREQVWAIKLNGNNNYRFMAKEEEQLFDLLITRVYKNVGPDKVKNKEMIRQWCIENNKSAKELVELEQDAEVDFFKSVVLKFRDLTNNQIVNACNHTIIKDFEIDEDEEYKQLLFNLLDKYAVSEPTDGV